MPQFVIEREIPGAGNFSDAELREVARKSVGVLKEMGAVWSCSALCASPGCRTSTA
jgi:hypothetical protein